MLWYRNFNFVGIGSRMTLSDFPSGKYKSGVCSSRELAPDFLVWADADTGLPDGKLLRKTG